MQAADLIGRIAVVMKQCGEDQLMGHLGQVLFEYLGEVSVFCDSSMPGCPLTLCCVVCIHRAALGVLRRPIATDRPTG